MQPEAAHLIHVLTQNNPYGGPDNRYLVTIQVIGERDLLPFRSPDGDIQPSLLTQRQCSALLHEVANEIGCTAGSNRGTLRLTVAHQHWLPRAEDIGLATVLEYLRWDPETVAVMPFRLHTGSSFSNRLEELLRSWRNRHK